MESKIYLTIAIATILAFALIAAIPTTSVSAIIHEGEGGNMTEDGNMTQGQTGNMNGGEMTEGQMGQ